MKTTKFEYRLVTDKASENFQSISLANGETVDTYMKDEMELHQSTLLTIYSPSTIRPVILAVENQEIVDGSTLTYNEYIGYAIIDLEKYGQHDDHWIEAEILKDCKILQKELYGE